VGTLDSGAKALVITILGAILTGILIIAFNKDYRPEQISLSNKKFFPTVEALSKNGSEYEDRLGGGDE